jgi:hypothetical protein
VDLITFTGNAGAVVDLTLVQTAGFPDPFGRVLAHATVFAPSGAQVAAFNANSQNTLTLPESGTYVVRINANTLVHTGSYTLGMECRSAPIANAGPDQSVSVGSMVQLTGAGSSDPDNDPLTDQWSFVSRPAIARWFYRAHLA